MIGKKFNNWVVLKEAGKNKYGRLLFRCKCLCGKERDVEGKSIRNGSSKSCGHTNIIDLTGRQFSKWTVMRLAGRKYKTAAWLCVCQCGVERIVSGSELRRGKSKSCGCSALNARKDLKGKKIGYWTVIRMAGHNKHNQILWLCRCICGYEQKIIGGQLRQNRGTSCGCRGLKPGEIGFRKVYKAYLKSAYVRKIAWRLSEKQFRLLTQQPCYYCGELPARVSISKDSTSKRIRDKSIFLYNGIDRVDSRKGYSKDNCISCCTVCNLAKLDTPKKDYMKWISKVYKHRVLKGTEQK